MRNRKRSHQLNLSPPHPDQSPQKMLQREIRSGGGHPISRTNWHTVNQGTVNQGTVNQGTVIQGTANRHTTHSKTPHFKPQKSRILKKIALFLSGFRVCRSKGRGFRPIALEMRLKQGPQKIQKTTHFYYETIPLNDWKSSGNFRTQSSTSLRSWRMRWKSLPPQNFTSRTNRRTQRTTARESS